jgi:hypothetical protein
MVIYLQATVFSITKLTFWYNNQRHPLSTHTYTHKARKWNLKVDVWICKIDFQVPAEEAKGKIPHTM